MVCAVVSKFNSRLAMKSQLKTLTTCTIVQNPWVQNKVQQIISATVFISRRGFERTAAHTQQKLAQPTARSEPYVLLNFAKSWVLSCLSKFDNITISLCRF